MSGDVLKLYIAGPMSGIPQFNFPAFIAAGETLREQGYETVNPAEMDLEDDANSAMESEDGVFDSDGTTGGKTWGDFLMRDVKLIADEVDGVCLLNGWHNSRGARLEAFVALQLQKPVYELNGKELEEIPPVMAMGVISQFTVNQGDVSRYG